MHKDIAHIIVNASAAEISAAIFTDTRIGRKAKILMSHILTWHNQEPITAPYLAEETHCDIQDIMQSIGELATLGYAIYLPCQNDDRTDMKHNVILDLPPHNMDEHAVPLIAARPCSSSSSSRSSSNLNPTTTTCSDDSTIRNLIVNSKLLPEEAARSIKMVESFPHDLAQKLLDEQSGTLDAGLIKVSPVSYLYGIVKKARKGHFGPAMAFTVASKRKQKQHGTKIMQDIIQNHTVPEPPAKWADSPTAKRMRALGKQLADHNAHKTTVGQVGDTV